MQNLYINGAFVGKVKGRRKRGGDIEAWQFLMDGGYFITVEMANIKLFDSCGDLKIVTFG